MPQPFRVALLIESSRGFGRNVLAGIAAYARAFGPWIFYHEERALADPMPAQLRLWRPQGLIARIENQSLARCVRRLGVPTVNLSGERSLPGIPTVVTDDEAIVRAAVEHLQKRRLEHFAYCGFRRVAFSDIRCGHFVQQLAAAGHSAALFDGPSPSLRTGPRSYPVRSKLGSENLAAVERDAILHSDALGTWLRALPKPVGLMACNDMRAYQVLSVCREQGIRVPEEVALIGVDNDPVQCELCDPPLSSVDSNAQRLGYEAAALLDRLLQRDTTLPPLTLVPPVGVVARRSTDLLAVADREVIQAVQYLREHACQGLTPTQLVRHTALSRSTLERWFAEHLGHTVHEELCRVRVDRVKDLLVASDLPLAEIAERTGFAHSETMQRLFKKTVGQTPGQYRAERRTIAVPPA